MLDSSARRILDRLDPGDRVLDVGGWAKPFSRADWVIDLQPYETRGLYGQGCNGETCRAGRQQRVPPQETAPALEGFTRQTWVTRDICAREPWPFADDQFAFAICSHTLEDVRDPVWVCSELARVARAGYVEVPSRLEEQTWGIQGPWVGWGHHHWLVDVAQDGIDFVFKHHILHGRESDHFPAGFAATLTPEQRVQCLWWEGGFTFAERIFAGPEEIDAYLQGFVAVHGPPRRPRGPLARLRGSRGR